jgi:hypothetical protein
MDLVVYYILAFLIKIYNPILPQNNEMRIIDHRCQNNLSVICSPFRKVYPFYTLPYSTKQLFYYLASSIFFRENR